MTKSLQKRWKRDCIYCGKPAVKNREHVFPKHVGYLWPMGILCASCNNELGAVVDSCWPDDYWIALREGRVDPAPERSDRFVIVTDHDSKERLVEPFTSRGTWRAVAKIAFECLSFIIRDSIFDPTLDEWRRFIQYGSPNLVGKKMHRVRYHPGLWGDHHEVSIGPKTADRTSSCIYVVIFGVYEFMLDFDTPYPEDMSHYQLGVDLDQKLLHIRTASGYRGKWVIEGTMRVG